MKSIIKISTLLLIFLLIGACAARGPYKERVMKVKDMQSSKSSLLYGQIIMPSDMWYMEHVELRILEKLYRRFR